jgi:hypothetical protein
MPDIAIRVGKTLQAIPHQPGGAGVVREAGKGREDGSWATGDQGWKIGDGRSQYDEVRRFGRMAGLDRLLLTP